MGEGRSNLIDDLYSITFLRMYDLSTMRYVYWDKLVAGHQFFRPVDISG